ncbi:MAG: MarR family transcriptional regulator [Bacteroidota bacterium]
MKIEEAIHQSRPFRSDHQRAVVNLIYTHNWLAEQLKSFFKPYGITSQQYNVLRILKGAGKPISTSIIRERLLYKMADASRMVDRLHQKKLVIRKVCISDKRLVDVKLSKKGNELLELIDKDSLVMDSLMQSLSSQEALLLSDLLDKARTE